MFGYYNIHILYILEEGRRGKERRRKGRGGEERRRKGRGGEEKKAEGRKGEERGGEERGGEETLGEGSLGKLHTSSGWNFPLLEKDAKWTSVRGGAGIEEVVEEVELIREDLTLALLTGREEREGEGSYIIRLVLLIRLAIVL